MKTSNQDNAELLMAMKEIDTYAHGHLPAASAYCRCLQVSETINTLVQSEMLTSPGQVVTAMVLDVLSGRSPLYHVKEFLSVQDRALLLGEDIDPERFNDYTLARSLDAIAAYGTGRIITELGVKAVQLFQLDTSAVSYDTTSTSVWGEYRSSSEEDQAGPFITFGHSKDNQPQLKQFMTELLCVDRGVPIFGKVLDGNSSDKTSNNKILTQISSLLAKHKLGAGAFVYVADSAMVTEQNLKAIGDNHFITRLPASYNACQSAIDQAMAAKSWQELGTLNEVPTSKTRPSAVYKAFETDVILHDMPFRAIVIHSSSHDMRRQKKLAKQIVQSLADINKKLKKITVQYYCEDDATTAAEQIEKYATHLHRIIPVVTAVPVRKRGRPTKDKPAPTETRYQLSWEILENIEGIEKERESSGCFVLITNVPVSGTGALDSDGVLRTYKGQYGVERDFAFLKDPLIVNDLFLKTPARIDALGMILIIALLIVRLMELHMRRFLDVHDEVVIGLNNIKTKKPTYYAMTHAVLHIQVLLIGQSRYLKIPLSDRQSQFIKALGLDHTVFTDPKCKPIIIPPKCDD